MVEYHWKCSKYNNYQLKNHWKEHSMGNGLLRTTNEHGTDYCIIMDEKT
jgi:hypothetical protein